MSNPNFNVEIQLLDDKVKLSGLSKTNPEQPVRFDYKAPVGTGDGFAGLELLLMSFSGCVSTAVLFLLRKRGFEVSSLSANVGGYRRENPLSLERIEYNVSVCSSNATESDIEAVLETARTMSPVWRSLSDQIQVETSFTLLK